MLKIIEVKETLENTKLVDNIYDIQKITRDIINQLEFTLEINRDDYNYLNIVMEKTKKNLQKIHEILNI